MQKRPTRLEVDPKNANMQMHLPSANSSRQQMDAISIFIIDGIQQPHMVYIASAIS